jgi:hypothetical protein
MEILALNKIYREVWHETKNVLLTTCNFPIFCLMIAFSYRIFKIMAEGVMFFAKHQILVMTLSAVIFEPRCGFQSAKLVDFQLFKSLQVVTLSPGAVTSPAAQNSAGLLYLPKSADGKMLKFIL